MNPLEIALIIIGIIIIIISCRLVDHAQKSVVLTAGKTFDVETSITEEDKEKIKNKIDALLSEVSEEVIVRTDDTISKLSNEKIIAVNEFSDQILEKINRNHEEVVFLYSMLNDKEKELKSAVKEIDNSKRKMQDIIENRVKNDNAPTSKEIKTPATPKSITQAAQINKTAKTEKPTKKITEEIETPSSFEGNNNTQILTLYSRGKSVMEISKLLGLGQGEVKLVIDLFKGKK